MVDAPATFHTHRTYSAVLREGCQLIGNNGWPLPTWLLDDLWKLEVDASTQGSVTKTGTKLAGINCECLQYTVGCIGRCASTSY